MDDDMDQQLAEARARLIELWDTPTLDERSRQQIRDHAAAMTWRDLAVTPRAYHASDAARKRARR